MGGLNPSKAQVLSSIELQFSPLHEGWGFVHMIEHVFPVQNFFDSNEPMFRRWIKSHDIEFHGNFTHKQFHNEMNTQFHGIEFHW